MKKESYKNSVTEDNYIEEKNLKERYREKNYKKEDMIERIKWAKTAVGTIMKAQIEFITVDFYLVNCSHNSKMKDMSKIVLKKYRKVPFYNQFLFVSLSHRKILRYYPSIGQSNPFPSFLTSYPDTTDDFSLPGRNIVLKWMWHWQDYKTGGWEMGNNIQW